MRLTSPGRWVTVARAMSAATVRAARPTARSRRSASGVAPGPDSSAVAHSRQGEKLGSMYGPTVTASCSIRTRSRGIPSVQQRSATPAAGAEAVVSTTTARASSGSAPAAARADSVGSRAPMISSTSPASPRTATRAAARRRAASCQESLTPVESPRRDSRQASSGAGCGSGSGSQSPSSTMPPVHSRETASKAPPAPIPVVSPICSTVRVPSQACSRAPRWSRANAPPRTWLFRPPSSTQVSSSSGRMRTPSRTTGLRGMRNCRS